MVQWMSSVLSGPNVACNRTTWRCPRTAATSETGASDGRSRSCGPLPPVPGFGFRFGLFPGLAPRALRCRPSGTDDLLGKKISGVGTATDALSRTRRCARGTGHVLQGERSQRRPRTRGVSAESQFRQFGADDRFIPARLITPWVRKMEPRQRPSWSWTGVPGAFYR
jgi:hypothetical protein